jgi:hypothetical protein
MRSASKSGWFVVSLDTYPLKISVSAIALLAQTTVPAVSVQQLTCCLHVYLTSCILRANCRLPLKLLDADALLVTDPEAKRQAAYGTLCLARGKR